MEVCALCMTEPAYVSLRFKFMRFESIDENSDFMPSMIKIKNRQFLEPFFITLFCPTLATGSYQSILKMCPRSKRTATEKTAAKKAL